MFRLFDPATALPTDERGKSPMQPVCARRLQKGRECLVVGARADKLEMAREALDDIFRPLLACQFHNDGLPCARACSHNVEKVFFEYQEIVLSSRLSA